MEQNSCIFVALPHLCVICLTSPCLKTLQTGVVLKHVSGPLWMLRAWNNSGGGGSEMESSAEKNFSMELLSCPCSSSLMVKKNYSSVVMPLNSCYY